MYKLTPELVKNIFYRMAKRHNAIILDKSNSKLMKYVSYIVGLFSPISSSEFLNRYSTTIGNRMYFNFKIGDPVSKPLDIQLRILAHELRHVYQAYNNPLMMYYYLRNSSDRALYESDAFGVSVEFRLNFYANQNIEEMARKYSDKLSNYACNSKDIKSAYSAIMAEGRMIKTLHKSNLFAYQINEEIFTMIRNAQ